LREAHSSTFSHSGNYGPAWTDSIYLSQDDVFDPSTDTRLGSFTYNGNLDYNQSYTKTATVNLPNAISGTYHLFMFADADDSLVEGLVGSPHESNNLASIPLTIHLSQSPDLQVTSVNAPTTAYSCQPITINWSVGNVNPFVTVSGPWYDAVYLSKDQYLDPQNDLYLGSYYHTLADGPNYSASLTATLPASASGPYYVFVVTDSTNLVYEGTAEDNNAAFAPTATIVSMAPTAVTRKS